MTWIILWNELFKSPSINWCFHKIFSRNQCSACSIPKGNKRGLHHFTSIFMINWLLYIVKFGYNSLSTLFFDSSRCILIKTEVFTTKSGIYLTIYHFDLDSNAKYTVLAVFIQFVVNSTLILSFLLKALSPVLIKFNLLIFYQKH